MRSPLHELFQKVERMHSPNKLPTPSQQYIIYNRNQPLYIAALS
jgi:hypothetical protein